MGKTSKATKNFSKNHLQDDLKQRRQKKKIQFRDKKKWTGTKTPEQLALEKAKKKGTELPCEGSDSSEEEEEEEEEVKVARGAPEADAYAGNVDSFLEKGFFEALEDEEEEEEDSEDGEEDEGDDEEDDEEEEGEGAEADGDAEDDDADTHKQDLERLRAEQPEFFKYLQENDEELLNFGQDGSDEEAGGGEGADADSEEGGEEGEEEGEEGEDVPVLTLKLLTQWTAGLSKGGAFATLRDLVRAFESACHLDDVDDLRGKPKVAKEDTNPRFKFRIVSGLVFERLMRLCVTKMHLFFGAYLEMQDLANAAPRKINPQGSVRWKRVANVAKAYVKTVVSFIETLTDPAMVHLLLRHAERMMPYIRPFPKIARKLLKVALRVFGGGEENRVQAFLVVRRLALEMPFPFIEGCFKGLYLTYVRHCKFSNPNVAAGQAFMAQCVVELFGLDLKVAYEHAFVYIRQLAIQLRAALTSAQNKSAETHQVISSWQFVNSLKLWARVVSPPPER